MFKLNLQFFGGRGSGAGKGGYVIPIDQTPFSNTPRRPAPETLRSALGSRGEEKSPADAMLETNPYYDGDYREFSHNCQRVVVAYEARRRGYDVMAQPTFEGDKLNRVAYYDSKNNISRGRWMGAFQDAKPVDVSAVGKGTQASQNVVNNIENQMKSYGNGSRGVVQLFYKGGGGHVFNVEQRNGKTYFIEAQTGKVKDMQRLMDVMRTDRVALVRTDNLKFSDRAKQFVEPSRRGGK